MTYIDIWVVEHETVDKPTDGAGQTPDQHDEGHTIRVLVTNVAYLWTKKLICLGFYCYPFTFCMLLFTFHSKIYNESNSKTARLPLTSLDTKIGLSKM